MQAHGPSLVTMLWRILGNESDVCDAYQDTFVQLAALEQREGRGVKRPQHVKAYVFRTASNVAMSMLRRSRIHAQACRKLASGGEASMDHAAAQENDLDARRLQDDLRRNIARLPERLQSVVVLKDLAELPYSQVAATLGISVATTRVYRCRAIRLLGYWMARMERER